MSYISNISSIYQIGKIIYGILYNSRISGSNSISVPISISIPYNNSFDSVKNDMSEIKDLDFFQMDKLLTWMKFFFEDNNFMNDIKDIKDIKDVDENNDTIKAYKQELYNIYVGIKSDYIQYKNWKKYNNSLWVMTYYRSKNTKDLSKKIISDIQLFNDGLKMFSIIFKDKNKNKNE